MVTRMTAFEARLYVYRSTRDSALKFAARLKPSDIAPTATAGDVKRVAHQLRKLAEMMDGKIQRAEARRGLADAPDDDVEIPAPVAEGNVGTGAVTDDGGNRQAGEGGGRPDSRVQPAQKLLL